MMACVCMFREAGDNTHITRAYRDELLDSNSWHTYGTIDWLFYAFNVTFTVFKRTYLLHSKGAPGKQNIVRYEVHCSSRC